MHDEFLQVAADFQLGMLDTERPHPKTTNLSRHACEDLPAAVELLREVDRDALHVLGEKFSAGEIHPLARAIAETLDAGNRIFLCGCGATGRLSISLEIFARAGLLAGATDENVIGFMAGGDAALIRSIERFEDRPDYGERQLLDLGFADGDLLISSTEGGETPFVIGATETAAQRSGRAPFFLYCNPDDLLAENVERSRRVISNSSIRKINLAVGPMALSGSTRMQASTVLTAAIGFAMKHCHNPDGMASDFNRWRNFALDDCDWSFLEIFTRAESATYEAGDFVLYEPGEFGITVLTDTTERSPTFTLTPFERVGNPEPASLCYLHLPQTDSPGEAWHSLLDRDPRPLEWGDLSHLTSASAMARFDFSSAVVAQRNARISPASQFPFQISAEGGSNGIEWEFRGHSHTVRIPGTVDFLGQNLLLKMLLNTHSTLIMGRLDRYEGNLMTYVSANNYKLIDRAVRYVRLLLEHHHDRVDFDYETVARQLLQTKETLGPDEPIVLKTVEALLKSG
ncbi:MAG: SIS domain-containing protein [Verrucomicrobiales bacterium]|nr:SIS domain-containing protein [Verrucomicrobiales bacterium]